MQNEYLSPSKMHARGGFKLAKIGQKTGKNECFDIFVHRDIRFVFSKSSFNIYI